MRFLRSCIDWLISIYEWNWKGWLMATSTATWKDFAAIISACIGGFWDRTGRLILGGGSAGSSTGILNDRAAAEERGLGQGCDHLDNRCEVESHQGCDITLLLVLINKHMFICNMSTYFTRQFWLRIISPHFTHSGLTTTERCIIFVLYRETQYLTSMQLALHIPTPIAILKICWVYIA